MIVVSDPNSKALFNPQHSVFVAANAGSGKTSLLVKRVVSLLLHNVHPHRILCLTYTNAAAAEMSSRITTMLASWVMMDDCVLKEHLSKLTDQPTDARLLTFARSLFATVLDAPMGMQIQTIHGFCQSLLARFPLEAGVDMHQSIMDDHSQQQVMREAILSLFNDANADVKASLYYIVQHLGEYNLQELLTEIVSHKQKFKRLLEGNVPTELLVAQLYAALGMAIDARQEDMIAHYAPSVILREACQLLATESAPTNQKCFAALSAWLETSDVEAFYDFATTKGSPKKSLVNKNILPAHLEETLYHEQARVIECMQSIFTLRNARLSEHMLRVSIALMRAYEHLKTEQGLTDFDDQILKATALLTQSGMAAWVLYKLDGGIDHILVDEAQDTSPEQWTIVRALTDEFLSGQGAKDVARSLFIVGDEKQSIFRFQGADPTGLARARNYFSKRLEEAGLTYINATLTSSYRSAPEIISLVDHVFSSPLAYAGLSSEAAPTTHQTERSKAKGYAEFWPLAAANPDKHQSAHHVLAEHIAAQIKSWIDTRTFLPEKKRAIEAGDIMVLVRTRGGVMYPLARALKRLKVPVAGVDRVHLLDELVIHDLLAFADILLFPDDDLMLAGLLKSPLFEVNEDTLFQFCYERIGTLWQALSGHAPSQLLSDFRAKVDYASPFALFSELLEVRGVRKRITGRMGEEMDELLDEFLEQCLIYEKSHTPSMQGFLNWMRAGDSAIKRDMEQAGSAVRIMTVHGAKGLQAPIVFVADTTSMPSLQNDIHWHAHGSYTLPLMSTKAAEESALLQATKQRFLADEMDEYRRLLYVALTRAEDWLIVCGAEHNKGARDDTWYRLAEPAFHTLGRKEGERWLIGESPAPSTDAAAPTPQKIAIRLLRAAPAEPIPPRPLTPSHLASDAPAQMRPVTSTTHIERGVAIHRLFQHLPSISQAEWEKAAKRIASNHAPSLDENARNILIEEAFRVLRDPQFAPIFSQDALAEVPVSGLIEWKGAPVSVSGQIDRLWIGEKEVWIIDFKSHATPPAQIPDHYVQQLALYKALLSAIYPQHAIRAGLVWTSIPRLDFVGSKVLDEVPAHAYI